MPAARGTTGLIFAGIVLAAALLLVAEFATLYQVNLANRPAPLQTVSAGSHNSYAMIPIALVAVGLGVLVWRVGIRLGLLALGALGVVGLLIALLHDLPDAHAVGLAEHNRVSATTTPGAGLYLETLGSILLLGVSGAGLMLVGLPRRRGAAGGSGAAPRRAAGARRAGGR